MFYDRFIELCKERGVAPTRAAIEAGLSKSTVTKWKNTAESEPSGTAIRKLADYFQITRAELLGEESAQKEKPLVNGDEELTEYLDILRKQPGLKMMFQLTKDATKEDVEKAVKVLEAMFGKDEDI